MSQTPAERQAKYRAKNAEKVREYARQKYHQMRDETLSLLGGRCAECGFADRRALEIDHIEPKSRTGQKQWHQEMRMVRSRPDLYQILCANCHTIKSKGEY